MDWIQRTEAELYGEYKQAVLAFSDRKLVGDLVYQPHKQLPKTLELKNLRIHPQLRRRDLGHFMLRQAEVEARRTGQFDLIMVDARASQQDVLRLLQFTGYREVSRGIFLYDDNKEDVVFVKSLCSIAA